MTGKKNMTVAVSVAVATGLLFSAANVHAQESANDELNACVKKEQLVTTAKGAGLGAIAGLTSMLVAHKKQDALAATLVGAAAGGIAGFAVAYYTAIDTCYKKNPGWLPESDIQRTKDYDKVRKEIHYKPSQGIVTRAEAVTVAQPVQPDGQAQVDSQFIVMTPDGAETPVTVERRLYVVGDDGKETQVPFPGRTSEQHTFAPGEQQDSVRVPIPHDAKPGTVYRFEIAVSAGDRPPAVASQRFSVSG